MTLPYFPSSSVALYSCGYSRELESSKCVPYVFFCFCLGPVPLQVSEALFLACLSRVVYELVWTWGAENPEVQDPSIQGFEKVVGQLASLVDKKSGCYLPFSLCNDGPLPLVFCCFVAPFSWSCGLCIVHVLCCVPLKATAGCVPSGFQERCWSWKVFWGSFSSSIANSARLTAPPIVQVLVCWSSGT